MPRSKTLISWSSGKDSAFALHEVRRTGEFEIVGVLTTVTETFGRVAIHGVLAEPMCSHRLAVATGERVQRDGYAYCDLVMES